MKQYLDLVQAIQERGTYKPAAREGMPGTQSLFGYQFRHNLQEGFPLLTTKMVNFPKIVTELLWFLKGDTNIKFLNQRGFTEWNEDAYNYYIKLCKDQGLLDRYTFEEFISVVVNENCGRVHALPSNYIPGDCGFQYGKVWRNWNAVSGDILQIKTPDNVSQAQREQFKKEWEEFQNNNRNTLVVSTSSEMKINYLPKQVDQITKIINQLKNNPQGRRHVVTAVDPAHDEDLALYWCHSLFQFNCRPIPDWERKILLGERPEWKDQFHMIDEDPAGDMMEICDEENIPKYYLDCQLYQRSADVFLGVPFNIASYALLTMMVAKICNMVPGDYIHTFGDVHIYDNHKEQLELQLSREPKKLPTLKIHNGFVTEWYNIWNQDIDKIVEQIIQSGSENIFELQDYDHHPFIKGTLSTGLKK